MVISVPLTKDWTLDVHAMKVGKQQYHLNCEIFECVVNCKKKELEAFANLFALKTLEQVEQPLTIH